MFTFEAAFHRYRRKHGIARALADYADLQDAPMQHALDATSSGLAILWPPKPTVFDFNEHFLELSNLRNDEPPRWIALMILVVVIPLCLLMSVGLLWFLWDIVFVGDSHMPFPPNSLEELGLLLGMLVLSVLGVPMTLMLWRECQGRVFTARCARYRFNRTTGKAYVLRPARWGGNAVLDWSRVQAHVHWAPPAESAQSEEQRRGEDLIWVGPRNSGERLWRYIQTFMQKGMDAVPAPDMPNDWMHKGRNPEHVFNWLAECLCYWPVFPAEWKSDVGQTRRENGIGPEQPLSWPAKLP